MPTYFNYDGVTVLLPPGHKFVETTKYDGSVEFTNDGMGSPTTVNESVAVGTGTVSGGNKFTAMDTVTNLFQEGVREGDLLELSGASNPANNGSFTIIGFDSVNSLYDTVLVSGAAFVGESGISYAVVPA